MRRIEIAILLAATFGFSGCATTTHLYGGKGILNLPDKRVYKFLEMIGCQNNGRANVSRSTTGDLLFVQFQNPAGTAKVAIVSSDHVTLKDLPGFARLDDAGNPVFWYDEREKKLHFANGSTLATNIYWKVSQVADARFVAFFGGDRGHWWIARAESPLEEVVTFAGSPEIQLIISYGDKLHVFVSGPPEGKLRRDGRYLLKRYEYELEGTKAHLLQVQDFYETFSVMDFDPESNLLHASSRITEFAHGWLINTVTGKKQNTGYGPGRGWFLQDGVMQRFQEALRGHPLMVQEPSRVQKQGAPAN